MEINQQRIQFVLESGNFHDFSADVQLHACGEGTILTYSVQATPTIPVPSLFIQMDLPNNMRQMRRVMCGR
jgi:carbon monoxide dehydrogenase subunit G